MDRKRLFTNRTLMALFIPLILEKILEYSLGLADSLMIAHVGEAAISGVSLVDAIMSLLISVFAALATGGAVATGQYLGSGDRENACRSADQLIWFTGACGLVVMAAVYLGRTLILNVLYQEITDQVRIYAGQYLTIVAVSIPFIGIYNAGAALFRAMDNSRLPLQIMLISNIYECDRQWDLIHWSGDGCDRRGVIYSGITYICRGCYPEHGGPTGAARLYHTVPELQVFC